MSELCKSCQTPMTVAKNKNGGYFATCPNKANHEMGKPVAKAKGTPAAAPPPPSPPAAKSTRTVFGW